jgi:hypothetical protein
MSEYWLHTRVAQQSPWRHSGAGAVSTGTGVPTSRRAGLFTVEPPQCFRLLEYAFAKAAHRVLGAARPFEAEIPADLSGRTQYYRPLFDEPSMIRDPL